MALDSDIARMLGEEPSEEQETEGQDTEAQAEEQEAQGTEETQEEGGEEQVEQQSEESAGSEESEEGESESDEGEESEVEKLKKQNELLQQRLNEQAAQTQTQTSEDESEKSKSDPLEDLDPIGDYDFESIAEDKETFQKWAKDFGRQIYQKAQEDFFQQVPQVVQKTAQEQIYLRDKAKEFYDNNQDLAGVKDFVAQTTNQVHSEHPDWNFDDVLGEAANRAREALGLEKQAAQKEKESRKKPKVPSEGTSKKSGKRGEPQDQRSEMEREIDAMLNTVG
ncbi:MAG: hypothetical protein V5A79_06585 [Candidatus Bipolaricaulota bacterium]